MKTIRYLLGALALCTGAATAMAQGLVMFPADNYGKVNKSFEESALNEAQLEILMGKAAMFEPVAELDEANPYRQLARSVAMLDLIVEGANGIRQNTVCTATRIARDLLLTNYHCVPGRDHKAVQVQARFGFVDPQTAPGKLYSVDLKPIEASAALDYAILKLTSAPAEAEHPPLPLKRHTARDGESLILIHHPMGQAQRLTRFRCQAGRPAFNEGRLIHHCDTLGGSSGSLVLTLDGFAFAGLHFAGVPNPDRPYNVAKPAEDLFKASATLRGLESKPAPPLVFAPELSAAEQLERARASFRAGWAAEQSQDFPLARQHYQDACKGGEEGACYNLGLLYKLGRGGPQDLSAARKMYEQSCNGGYLPSCTNLGILYANGEGVTQDYVTARGYYGKACSGADMLGCAALGNLTYLGIGGSADTAEGTRLLRQSCSGGNQWGCDRLTQYGLSK